MQVELSDGEYATLAAMNGLLGSQEVDISIDDVFRLISKQHGRGVRVLNYHEGPLWVKISPDATKEKSRLEIIMTQDTPSLRGDDRENIVSEKQYVTSNLSKAFMLPITSRIYKLDLSNIPCHVFSSVNVSVEYGPNTQVPFPHGNTIMLTSIGSIGQQNNWPVDVCVERCFLSGAFVSSLQKTVCLSVLRLWDCGVLDEIQLPELNYMHKLSLRLFHPLSENIARIDFSLFRMLKSLVFCNDMRVVSMLKGYKDVQPGSGMLQHAAQGLDKYRIEFNDGVPHEMKRVRVHLAYEDMCSKSLNKILRFFKIDKLFVETSPPEHTHLYVPFNGDVYMASAVPLTCAEYVKSEMAITIGDETCNFLKQCPPEFLRIRNLINDDIPFDRTHAALCQISKIAQRAKILLVVLGRTASVLAGALPCNPLFGMTDYFSELHPYTLSYVTEAKHTAAWAFSCGPLTSPVLGPVAAPPGYARLFVSTLDTKWSEPNLCAASEEKKVFLGRASISRKNLLAQQRGWDSNFVSHEFFVLFINPNYRVDIPSAYSAKLNAAHATFPIPVNYPESNQSWWYRWVGTPKLELKSVPPKPSNG